MYYFVSLILKHVVCESIGSKAEDGTSWISNFLADRRDTVQDWQHPANPAKEASDPRSIICKYHWGNLQICMIECSEWSESFCMHACCD